MQKQLIGIVSLLGVFWLYSNYQQPLESKLTVTPNTSYNLSAKPSNSSDNSVIQPTRLEISLKQRQVTLYEGKNQVKSYPIAVGRSGWETPTGTFRVAQMLKNPTWIHPFTDEKIAGGTPQNPLGNYWIGFWTDGRNWIGFHGTPDPESVGQAASHGCIRMHNKDIEELFHQVSLGTPVTVVQ